MADARPGKYSLLEIVQLILTKMDSDEVSSIGDTVESLQVADEVIYTFYELFGGQEEPARSNAFRLQALSDVSRPTHMKLPTDVKDIEDIYFDHQTDNLINWVRLKYLEPRDFIIRSMGFANDSAAVEVQDLSGVPFYVKNDADPRYFTSFDDEHVIFDSFDSTKMSSATEIRTMGFGAMMPSFRLEDNSVPPIPPDMFPLLISEAAQACFINLKQVSNAKEDQRSRRQLVRRQNNRQRMKRGAQNRVNSGRRSKI